MSERFTQNLDLIKGEFSENIRVLTRDVKEMEIAQLNVQNTLKTELDRIESLERYAKQHSKEISSLTNITTNMKENKVELNQYNEQQAVYEEKLRTLKYATQDTFRTLLATDNYIEKYLPYKIQEIISENFKATFDQLHPEFITKQKDYEYLRQKD